MTEENKSKGGCGGMWGEVRQKATGAEEKRGEENSKNEEEVMRTPSTRAGFYT
jgi:hypothetical protein